MSEEGRKGCLGLMVLLAVMVVLVLIGSAFVHILFETAELGWNLVD